MNIVFRRVSRNQYSIRVIYQPPRFAFAQAQAPTSVDASQDYYGTLKVERSATQKQIRQAFFNQAKKHHPDLNTHKSKKDYEKSNLLFQRINDAYQILSDKDSKERYDELINNIMAD